MKKKLASLTLSTVFAFAAFSNVASADAPLCAYGTIYTTAYGCNPPPAAPTWYEELLDAFADLIP
jgi:hypothetical protein